MAQSYILKCSRETYFPLKFEETKGLKWKVHFSTGLYVFSRFRLKIKVKILRGYFIPKFVVNEKRNAHQRNSMCKYDVKVQGNKSDYGQ
jgi:hypothetical protein